MSLVMYDYAGTVAGVDEAGRGCLAGPVVAAAVILPKNYHNPLLNDSKKLTAGIRDRLYDAIVKDAQCYAIAEEDPKSIDTHNILQATYMAMHKAIAALPSTPGLIVVDGNRFKPYPGLLHKCEVKGDGRFLDIAAASILAKVHRDRVMEQLHSEYPQYHWHKNKGYPTINHRKALLKYGHTTHHRLSFAGVLSTPLFGV